MNYLLDSNILLYAKINAMPEHLGVAAWLEEAVSDAGNTIHLCETSILSFLRIATNKKVFDPPLPTDEAGRFLDEILAYPNVNLMRTSPAHYSALVNLMRKNSFSGNLVMDAHLATLALGIGAILVTRDRDFAKVPYLKTLDPLKTSK